MKNLLKPGTSLFEEIQPRIFPDTVGAVRCVLPALNEKKHFQTCYID